MTVRGGEVSRVLYFKRVMFPLVSCFCLELCYLISLLCLCPVFVCSYMYLVDDFGESL